MDDALTTAPAAPLHVTASHSERDVGTRRSLWRGFVVIAGNGIEVEAEMDEDGEVSDLTGTYPEAFYKALCQIAEGSDRESCYIRGSGRRLTEWTISPAGEVEMVEDLLSAEAA